MREAGEILAATYGQKKTGEIFPCMVNARHAEIEGELMTVAFVSDISQSKKAEEALRESKRFLSSIFSSIQDGISILDKEFRIIQVNPAMEKWYADSMPLVGKKCYAAYHDRGRACKACPSRQTIKAGKPAYEIVPLKVRGNSIPGWLEVFSFPLKDELTGRTRGVIEYVRDITERKLTEQKLQESEEKYSLVTKETGQVIYDYNIETGDIAWSGAVRQVTGYAPQEFVFNIDEWEKRIHPEDRGLAMRLLAAARRKGQRYLAEYRFQVRDGRYREMRDTGIFLKDKRGRPFRMIGTMTDVTQHKRADRVKDAIYKISEAVNSVENLEELFRSIHNIIVELMPAKNFYIALYDRASETLSFPYFIDEFDPMPAPHKLGRGLTEYVLRTGEPLLALPEKFEELVQSGQVESIGAPSIDWLGVPLKTKDRTIGVLVVQTYTEGVRYREEDKDMLVFVSTQAAMAIERKRAEEDRRRSEETARAILNASPDLAFLIDTRGAILALNDSFAQTFGRSKEELLGTTAYGHIPPDLGSARKEHIEEVVRTGVPVRFEDERGGKFFDNAVYPILNPQGGAERVAIFAQDITARKLFEKALLDSLKEKEILLKEIHHRVKNNMQVISSLLNLQSKYLKDPTALEMFKESQNRIRSMALVHEKLYQSKDLSRINFAEYLQSVVSYLFRSYQVDSNLVQLKLNLEETFMNINVAIPCGLIVNELVSNCLKHAFPDGRSGRVAIEFKRKEDQRYGLIIQDDGVGFPQNLDFEKTETFGMQVVKTLVDQIDGAVKLDRRGGTTFTIEFGEPPDKPRL
jgi:PAS domain S-box-containing protein